MSMHLGILLAGVSVVSLAAPASGAVTPTAEEMDQCRSWVEAHLGEGANEPPFSFVYTERPSSELLRAWPRESTSEALDVHRIRRTTTWTDPATALEVRCVSIVYDDFPTVEWTVYIRNGGAEDTPILESLQALAIRIEGTGEGEFLLHHGVGSPCTAQDYQPLETVLEPGSAQRIAAAGGRPTNSDLCYFNLETPGGGLILALGWPGQWASEWVRDDARGLTIQAGQELTHFRLRPGEEVRTPLVALQFWQGDGPPKDWLRAQNVWRRWFIAHNIRRPGGELPPLLTIGGSVHTNMMVGATEENQIQAVDASLRRGLRPGIWWMDAGWYPCGGDWTCTGTWEPDPERFPRGLEPVTSYLRERGIRSVLWFEPERVRVGTWLDTHHQEWLLYGGPGDALLDLGNPEAWQWLVEHVDGKITSLGLDIYRQDFNMDPLPHWRGADAPDRQGITENHYVTGLLSYWDTLLARHPNLLYDNCASGGRRNDLESMRRGVPFTKSDYADDPVGVQGETYGLSLWIPYFAAVGIASDNVYVSRSRIAPVMGAVLDELDDSSCPDFPERLVEWERTARCYWGDFWPLTPYSLESDAWIAWQFDRADAGEGVIQAYRRAECLADTLVVRLRGLDPAAQYVVRDVDSLEEQRVTGEELATVGLAVRVPARPGAAIVNYRRE